MRASESFRGEDKAAGTYGPYSVTGGYYQRAAHSTWGGGSLSLKQLLPDNSTYLTLGTDLSADGVDYFYLPEGQYEIVITTATHTYFALTRVPLE